MSASLTSTAAAAAAAVVGSSTTATTNAAVASSAAVIAASAAAAAATASTTTTAATTPIWDIPDASQLETWLRTVLAAKVPIDDAVQKATVCSVLWKHLQDSVNSLNVTTTDLRNGHDDPDQVGSHQEDEIMRRPTKRAKPNPHGAPPAKRIKSIRHDPYHIWLHEPVDEDAEYDDVPTTFGGKLAQLTVAGLMNALSGIDTGGIVEHYKKIVPRQYQPDAQSPSSTVGVTQLTFAQMHQVATGLSRAIETRVQQDVLVTTPIRIQQMLAPELQPHEFKAIRKRIYDTVILGKGMNQHHNQGADEEELVVASANSNVHDVEKMKKCKICGNNDQSKFILDRKNGDVICDECGTVVAESLMHEGSQYRKFEGEQDRNHHGDAGNPLYSNAHNMSTTLSGVQMTAGAGSPGFGAARGGGARGLETILRNAHAYTELNISQFGKDEKRTRIGYKDRQKKEAFVQMAHVGDSLNLHDAVVQRAKELFSGFRDDREMVQQFKGVIAACLCEAFDQLSTDGKRILKQQEVLDNRLAVVNNSDGNSNPQLVRSSQARANRRNELHHASLAGKGGLLLDVNTAADVKAANDGVSSNGTATAAPVSSLEHKPISNWDLDDCRTWLLEASRTIAEYWYDTNKAMKSDGGAAATDHKSSNSSGTNNNTKIPQGTLEELEGRLVEHTFTLCDQLEQEMKSRLSGSAAKGGAAASAAAASAKTTSINKRVVTPRVNDLSRLAIKWQHAHERGSGGKGGVGNNAMTKAAAATAVAAAAPSSSNGHHHPAAGPTAGQVLLLKTSKKIGAMLKDEVAGDAFHKELRLIYGRQEAIKRKELRDEATRQRFQQMKRKPWLQARMQN